MESIDEPPPLPASRRVRARPGYRVVSFVYEYQSTRADGIGRRLGLR